jgi:membrane fusion protein
MPLAFIRQPQSLHGRMAHPVPAVAAPARPLLRQEAVAAANASHGGSLGLVPVTWSVVTGFLVAVVVGLIIFATVTGYARKVTSDGMLVPIKGAARVLPPRAGIVATVDVAAGDLVTAGQALFSLDTHRSFADGDTLDLKQQAMLSRQASLIDDQIAATETKAHLEDQRLADRITSLSAEVDSIAAQRALQAVRSRIAEDELKTIAPLRAQGLMSEVEYRNREDRALSLKQGVSQLEQQGITLRRNIEEAVGQRARLPAETADQLAKLRSAVIEIQQRQMEAEISGAEVVRAPVRGRVSALYVRPGQHVGPERPVLTLLPPDTGLQADLYVPARAIGFVSVGQPVRLRYEAFPSQQFGVYGGKVEQIDSTLLSPHDVDGPRPPAEPSYRVRVALDTQTVQAFGREVLLQPEMGVSADIVLERRSLLTWLLEPLYAMRGHI